MSIFCFYFSSKIVDFQWWGIMLPSSFIVWQSAYSTLTYSGSVLDITKQYMLLVYCLETLGDSFKQMWESQSFIWLFNMTLNSKTLPPKLQLSSPSVWEMFLIYQCYMHYQMFYGTIYTQRWASAAIGRATKLPCVLWEWIAMR